jgi:hypothetical protein
VICFKEETDTGFGDRLRGLTYLLHLAHRTGETRILYNDDETCRVKEDRWAAFPARMTDLIRIEGLDFDYHPLPLPRGEVNVVYDSIRYFKRDSRPGFPHVGRLRPRDDAVLERVREIGVDRTSLGFHVRKTDNQALSRRYFEDRPAKKAMRHLAWCSFRYRTKRVFLSADNATSLVQWTGVLRDAGYEVASSEPGYHEDRLRQTGTFEMLVDFFGLASSRRVIRLVPSEFSRFAAWMTGRRLRYDDLY